MNELVTLGLKPYDLVWVESRSAAWRYPSEIAELKEYSPIIEEQPYDRFYKKPSETQAAVKEPTISNEEKWTREEIAPKKIFINENIIKEEPVKKIITEVPNPSYSSYEEIAPKKIPVKENIAREEPAKKSIPGTPDYNYQHQPKKQVFVSMPENNGFNQYQQEEQYRQYLPKPKPVQEKPIPAEKTYSPAQEKSYSPIDIHESAETRVETKYSQSLDDIKDMYINTLVQRKTKNRRKEVFKKYIKPALIPLFLVISGVAIGYAITYKRNSSQLSHSVPAVIPQQNTPAQKIEETPGDNKILQPGETHNLVSGTKIKNRQSLNQRQALSIQSQKPNKNIQTIPKFSVPGKKGKSVFVPDDEVAVVQKKNVQVDPATGERTRAVRDNDEIVTRQTNNTRNNPERLNKKNNSERSFLETDRKNIRDFVSVRSNSYVRGAFGGIRGLELTVYNTSDFMLDEVSVELQIMKPSEQPLRTDIITFRNVAPNGAITVRVPDSQRGIRVDYHITNVESKQWQKSTVGL